MLLELKEIMEREAQEYVRGLRYCDASAEAYVAAFQSCHQHMSERVRKLEDALERIANSNYESAWSVQVAQEALKPATKGDE